MKDIVIIGAGVIGASIARVLSKYDLDILVLEKNNDIGDGASCANSAIIHSGYDPEPGTLKAELNVLGNKMFDQICSDLDVYFERNGSITIATNEEEVDVLNKLFKRSIINKVETKFLTKEELKELEPNITDAAIMGLFAPSAGIIDPFELTVALMENAIDNGVELLLNEEVIGIDESDGSFNITTKNNAYQAKLVINASGVYGDIINGMINNNDYKIFPRRGEYFVLDHFDNKFLRHTIFSTPSKKGKGVLMTPTTSSNYLIGPSSDFIDEREDISTHKEILEFVKEKAYNIMDKIPFNQVIRSFSGIRAVSNTDDFIIEETSKNFINVIGIQSPGLASSPAIATYVEDIIKQSRVLVLKDNYNPYRRPKLTMAKFSLEEKIKRVMENPKLGNIICRCEQVSEAEVVDAINRNAGARTVKGVKKRSRPGAGKCQGGFCEPLVVNILARELNIDPTEVCYDTNDSYILKMRLGDDNE